MSIQLKDIKVIGHWEHDEKKSDDMAASIKTYGLQQAIGLEHDPDKKLYRLLWGFHRLQAFKKLKLTKIADEWAKITPRDKIEKAGGENVRTMLRYIENTHRRTMSVQENYSIISKMDTDQCSVDTIAGVLNKSIAWVKRMLNLNNLSDTWKELFRENKIKWSIEMYEVIASYSHEQQDKVLYLTERSMAQAASDTEKANKLTVLEQMKAYDRRRNRLIMKKVVGFIEESTIPKMPTKDEFLKLLIVFGIGGNRYSGERLGAMLCDIQTYKPEMVEADLIDGLGKTVDDMRREFDESGKPDEDDIDGMRVLCTLFGYDYEKLYQEAFEEIPDAKKWAANAKLIRDEIAEKAKNK